MNITGCSSMGRGWQSGDLVWRTSCREFVNVAYKQQLVPLEICKIILNPWDVNMRSHAVPNHPMKKGETAFRGHGPGPMVQHLVSHLTYLRHSSTRTKDVCETQFWSRAPIELWCAISPSTLTENKVSWLQMFVGKRALLGWSFFTEGQHSH